MKYLIDQLRKEHKLMSDQYRALLTVRDPQVTEYLFTQAREVAQAQFGKGIFLRGLIELTNVCRND
jgi:biotin synthase